MFRLLSALRRQRRRHHHQQQQQQQQLRWPKKSSARVFDEAAMASAVQGATAARRPWGAQTTLLAIARAAASCLLCVQADGMEEEAARWRRSRQQLHAVEVGDLMAGEAVRFTMYL